MATTMLQAKALYANSADTAEELSFAAGDVLTVHERDVAGLVGWWLCSHAGRIGIAPGNRLQLLTPTNEATVVASSCRGDQQNTGKHDSSPTVKPRPTTAPQRGHIAQNNSNPKNKVIFCINIRLHLKNRFILFYFIIINVRVRFDMLY